jgi:hypothetical protein
MSTETTNLQLVKPTENDFYDINLINANMDKIDAAVAAKETPAGAQAKVDEHTNTADPHTEYIKKSLATSVNDFIIASAPGVFVKKTLTEIKTILGLGSAAYTASTAYATAAQGTKADNAATQASVNTHLADYIRQPGYGTSGGAGNAYTLALSPALTSYIAGVCIAAKINVTNTGASTISVNGLGSKTILDSKGNALTAGKLKMGIIYTMRYDGTNFILQGEGGYGNATASDLLSGKTASTDAGDIVGAMVNRVAVTITPSTVNQAIPEGYHNGSGYVFGDAELIAGNIKSGVNIFGVVGSSNIVDINSPIPLVAGNYTFAMANTDMNGLGSHSTVYYKTCELRVNRAGNLRAVGVMDPGGSSHAFTIKITKNGTLQGLEQSGAAGVTVTISRDITVVAGDYIQLYIKANGSGSGAGEGSTLELRCNANVPYAIGQGYVE